LSDAVDRTTKLRSISYRLVDAEAFGNQQLAFDLKKQQIELERINKLRALGSRAAPAAVEQINSQAALETYRLVQEQGKFARDLFESATKAVQSITRTLQDSTAQLLRLQGDPRAGLNRFLSTAAARGNVVAANQQLRPQFFTAANQAAQSFRNQGNELAAREIAAYANRIATATNVIERRAVGFIEANGIRTAINAAPPSTGAVGAQNKLFQDFIDVQRTEERLRQDIAGSNRELAKAQIDLATATGQLASPTAELASLMPTLTAVIESLTGKDWTVQVNVAADGSSKAFGDVLNGALN
jgi:hypothetical protein